MMQVRVIARDVMASSTLSPVALSHVPRYRTWRLHTTTCDNATVDNGRTFS